MNCLDMRITVAFLSERYGTVGALERLFTSMNANMILHIGGCGHNLRADWAHVFVMTKFDGFSILKQMEEFQMPNY